MASWSQNVVRSVKKFYNGHPYQLSQEKQIEPREQKTEPRNRIFLRGREEEQVPLNQTILAPEPLPLIISPICVDTTTQTTPPTTKTQSTCLEPEPLIPLLNMEEECTQTTDYDDNPCEIVYDVPERQQEPKEKREFEEKYILVDSENRKFKQCVLQRKKSVSDENEWEYSVWCIHDSEIDEFEKPLCSRADHQRTIKRQTSDSGFDNFNTGQNSDCNLECIDGNEEYISQVEPSSSDELPCVCANQELSPVTRNNSSKEMF